MGQSHLKKERFYKDHPFCCFCGGARPASTIDHSPPRACFPRGLMPEGFEFPSCKECNEGTSKQDMIFGFTASLVDFNGANRSDADNKRMAEHHREISRRWPEALPDPSSSVPVSRVGHIITPSPVAISVETTAAMKEAMEVVGEKLAHALYYRETGKIMASEDRFFAAILQIQRPGAESFTDYFKRVLPDITMGDRPNIRDYGNRFAYKSGWKPDDGFFVFAAQFGFGMLCWGMVLGPRMELSPKNDALATMNWRRGGNGLGNRIRSASGCSAADLER